MFFLKHQKELCETFLKQHFENLFILNNQLKLIKISGVFSYGEVFIRSNIDIISSLVDDMFLKLKEINTGEIIIMGNNPILNNMIHLNTN